MAAGLLLTLVALHVAAGVVAVVCGVGAMLTRKGSRRHRRFGRAYLIALVLLGGSAAVLAGLDWAGDELPTHPTLFCQVHARADRQHDDIVLPPESAKVDWEVELTIVIGRSVRRAGAAAAPDAIAGYTVLNDVSVRDYQHRTIQFLQGKTWESTTPVGPWLVTKDELPAPDGSGLAVSTVVARWRHHGRGVRRVWRSAGVVEPDELDVRHRSPGPTQLLLHRPTHQRRRKGAPRCR